MKTVLFLSDFEETSEVAFHYVSDLASRNNIKVILLHVAIPESSTVSSLIVSEGEVDDVPVYDTEAANSLSVKALNLLIENGVKDVKYLVEDGNLVECISKVVVEHEVDLVIMGTHIPNDYMEKMGNSNTSDIIQNLDRPILVVPPTAEVFNLNSLTFATTLKDDQMVAFHVLGDMQRLLGFKADILYLNDPADLYAHNGVKDRVEHLCSANGLKINQIFVSVHSEHIQQQIDEFVADKHTDMLAMVTHKRTGFKRWLFGSMSESAVIKSKIPVLIFEPAHLEG